MIKPREINDTIRYTMWSVFRRTNLDPPQPGEAEKLVGAIDAATSGSDLIIRGWYDVAGLRADADLMVWWHASSSETLQAAYQALRRSSLGRSGLQPVWSVMALHRPAEFNKGHVPAFMSDEEPKNHLCVYPFVRSYEWYLLPEEERRAMLVEHGMLATALSRRSGQHRLVVRPRRLRMDPRLRSRRAASDRRPDAGSPRGGGPPPHPRRGAVLHRPSPRPGRHPRLLVTLKSSQEAAGSRVSEMELMQ